MAEAVRKNLQDWFLVADTQPSFSLAMRITHFTSCATLCFAFVSQTHASISFVIIVAVSGDGVPVTSNSPSHHGEKWFHDATKAPLLL